MRRIPYTLAACGLPFVSLASTEGLRLDNAAEPVAFNLRPLGSEPHPYTTEAGRFIAEFTPFEYTHDRRNPHGERRRTDSFTTSFLLKYGVLDNLDLQVGADLLAWERQRDRNTGERDNNAGFGDSTVRLKYNFWGNDEGATALAVIPFLIFPTATDGVGERGIRGGAIIPFYLEPADGWGLDLVSTIAAVRNSEDDGYEAQFVGLVALGRELTEGVTLFTEFEASITTERGERWAGAAGIGLSFEINQNTVIEPVFTLGLTRRAGDAGNVLTRPTDDYAFSLTIVRRF